MRTAAVKAYEDDSIRRMYETEGRTVEECARALCLAAGTVKKRLNAMGVQLRPPGQRVQRRCECDYLTVPLTQGISDEPPWCPECKGRRR